MRNGGLTRVLFGAEKKKERRISEVGDRLRGQGAACGVSDSRLGAPRRPLTGAVLSNRYPSSLVKHTNLHEDIAVTGDELCAIQIVRSLNHSE